MNVEIYNQYYAVYDENKTLIHPSSGYTLIDSHNLSEPEAKNRVMELYNQAKNLGVQTNEKLVSQEKGYAEITITFEDGKILNKIIYAK